VPLPDVVDEPPVLAGFEPFGALAPVSLPPEPASAPVFPAGLLEARLSVR
jgi:hypothetical protein